LLSYWLRIDFGIFIQININQYFLDQKVFTYTNYFLFVNIFGSGIGKKSNQNILLPYFISGESLIIFNQIEKDEIYQLTLNQKLVSQ
jgi:hypothetical protein